MVNKIFVGKILDIKAKGKKGSPDSEEVIVSFECLLRKEKIEVLGVESMFKGYTKNSLCVLHVNEVGFPGSNHVLMICSSVKSVTENQIDFILK